MPDMTGKGDTPATTLEDALRGVGWLHVGDGNHVELRLGAIELICKVLGLDPGETVEGLQRKLRIADAVERCVITDDHYTEFDGIRHIAAANLIPRLLAAGEQQ